MTPGASASLPFTLQANQYIRQWSEDGRDVFVLTAREERAVLTRINLETGKSSAFLDLVPHRAASRLGSAVRLSRDGRTVVYTDNRMITALFLVEGVR